MLSKLRLPVAATVLLSLVILAGCGGTAQPAPAAATPAPVAPKGPIKLGIVTSRSGPLEAWGTDFLHGFEIGIDYATKGTKKVAGRDLTWVIKDDLGKADVGKQMAQEAFEKDQVDVLFGNVSSGITLAILPLLEQYKKVMIVEPAASDDITGKNFTRYAFRTGSSTGQDAKAGAAGAAKLGKKFVMLAPDYDWGKNSNNAWRAVLEKNGIATADIEDMYIDQNATDFVPALTQIKAKKPDVLIVSWSNPATSPKLNQQIIALGLSKDMKVTGGIADMRSMKGGGKDLVGTVGMVKYFHTFPKTKENDYLVSEYAKRFNGEKPELFSAGGMAAAIALVTALTKTNGDPDAEKLIAAMEGMDFNGPKGVYTFRKEDHQALQPMYVAEMQMNPGFDFPTPTERAEVSAQDSAPPITAKR